jgi:hypothetical protein
MPLRNRAFVVLCRGRAADVPPISHLRFLWLFGLVAMPQHTSTIFCSGPRLWFHGRGNCPVSLLPIVVHVLSVPLYARIYAQCTGENGGPALPSSSLKRLLDISPFFISMSGKNMANSAIAVFDPSVRSHSLEFSGALLTTPSRFCSANITTV